ATTVDYENLIVNAEQLVNEVSGSGSTNSFIYCDVALNAAATYRLLGDAGSTNTGMVEQVAVNAPFTLSEVAGPGSTNSIIWCDEVALNAAARFSQIGGCGTHNSMTGQAGPLVVAPAATVNTSQVSGDFGVNQDDFSSSIAHAAMVTASQTVGNTGTNVM